MHDWDLHNGTNLNGALMAKIEHAHAQRGKVTPEYRTWQKIKRRCLNPNYDHWDCYGGRGIIICQEWVHSFEAFLLHVGKRPSGCTSVDRIDNNKGYEPGNVRWATKKQQANNKRSNRRIFWNGDSLTVVQAAELTGLNPNTIHHRLDRGWTVSDTLTRPPGRNRGSR